MRTEASATTSGICLILADALRKSATKLESTAAALPDFEDGYQEWRSAFDQGRAGVWTASVPEAITGMESALNQ